MSNASPTWMDKAFQKDVQSSGTTLPSRPVINFLGNVSIADNPTNGSTDVSIGAAAGQFNTTLFNGLNSNISTTGLPTVRIGGPTSSFAVGGFQPTSGGAWAAGQTLIVVNTTTSPMTIVHEDTSSTSTNRIDTQSHGASVTLPPGKQSAAEFVYDGTENRLRLKGIGVVRPRVIDVRDYGAIGDGNSANAAANATAVSAAIAAQAAAGGGIVEFPPTGAAYVIDGPISVPSGIVIRGQHSQDQNETLGSVVSFVGTGMGFELASTCFDASVEDLLIVTAGSTGAAIGCAAGATLSGILFRGLKFLLGNPGKGAIELGSYASPTSNCQPIVFDRVNITAAVGQSVPLVGLWGTNGGMSNITFTGKSTWTGNTPSNTGTVLSGTFHVTNESTTVTTSAPQTLLQGQLLQFGTDGVVYEVAAAVNASTSITLATAYLGASNAALSGRAVAEMLHVESTDNNAVDNVIVRGVVAEVAYAGFAKFRGVRNSGFEDCWVGDLSPTNPINHLIWIGKSSAVGLNPPAFNITISHCQFDSGVQDAATVYTGNDASTQSVSIVRSVVPWVQNVPTGGPYTANQGYLPISYEGSGLVGWSGDQPSGTGQNLLSRTWLAALAPDPVFVTNGLNSNLGNGNVRGAMRLHGSLSNPFSIDGFLSWGAANSDGAELRVDNATGYPMTIVEQGSSSTAANRIVTGKGNVTFPPGQPARFFYVANDPNTGAAVNRWVLDGSSAIPVTLSVTLGHGGATTLGVASLGADYLAVSDTGLTSAATLQLYTSPGPREYIVDLTAVVNIASEHVTIQVGTAAKTVTISTASIVRILSDGVSKVYLESTFT